MLATLVFWLAFGLTAAFLLGGCGSLSRPSCACACLPAPDPRVVQLQAEVDRMRERIRAWDEVETLDDAVEAAEKAVGHAAR